jgi:threonine dehydrogenase-like Zn-dependent dehydrogenase
VAVFAEPLATCVHALSLAPGKLPRTAVVLGGGTIGTLAAQLLRADGAGRVIVSEPIAERHELLRGVADAVVRPEELHSSVTELTAGAGADLSIDAVGAASSRPASVEILGAGGCALWLGMHEQEATVPAFQMVVREQRVIGSFAYTNAEFADALGLLLSGHVVPAVASRRVPLDASGDAFRAHLAGSAGGVGKTIVHP